ncbi:MAG: cyclic nucleotide-binding domain-containing protein [Pseudomonadota bacterium]
MTLNEEIAVLRAIPMFANLETSRLKLVAFTCKRATFAANHTLFNAGDKIANHAFIVLRGVVDIAVNDQQGKQIVVAQMKKNDMFGEIALLCNVPRTAKAVTNEECELLILDKDNFFNLLKQFSDISIEIMKALAMRLEHMNKRLIGLQ